MNDQPIEAEIVGEHSTAAQALVVRPKSELPTVQDLEQQFALAVRQRELLSDYISKQLRAGKHFYQRGDQKPSLSKEGAEIILLPHDLVPDYEQTGGPYEPPSDGKPYQITVKCILRKKNIPNSFHGSGIGSAGSEKQKKDGTYIPRQTDKYLCHNATLKMAQKSAMIAATINSTAASEFFTQDMDPEAPEPPKNAPKAWVCPSCGQTNSAWAKECGRCETRKEAPQAPRGCPDAPQAAKTPHIASGAQERAPTEKNRTRMLEILTGPQGQFDTSTVQAFFHALHDPAPLMPNEGVLELNPRFCPKSQQEMESLKLSLGMFKAGEPAVWPYKPWVESVPEPTPAPKEESKDPQEKDPEWWRKIIVPIPRKGQKKADYERHPDTLGSLWELRHGNDEEAEIARRRLWGFCQHDKAEGWTDKKGQYHPPSNAEVRFFEAVQVFKAWLSANHPDETL